VELAAERAKLLLEINRVEIQLARNTEERIVIALTAERQNLRALRTEVRIDRRAAPAAAAHLKRWHTYAPNELPHPQTVSALGLLKTNPLLIRLVS
jgi:hypothetical protein